MKHRVMTARLTSASSRCSRAPSRPSSAAAGRASGRRSLPAREHGVQQVLAQLILGDAGDVERLAYLGLQAHLLVQADLEVGQHDQLRSPLGIRLEELPLVAHEGLPQVLLAVGRRAGPQSGEEAPERGRVRPELRPALLQVARELQPDLVEDLAVPAGNGVACQLERVERRVQFRDHPAETGVALEQPAANERPPHRRDRMQQLGVAAELALQLVEEILAADGLPRLPRRPGCERAPVRAAVAAARHRRRQPRIALGDLEVADDRIRDRGDPLHLRDARGGCVGQHGTPRRRAYARTSIATS